jgi:DNA-binding transcriptional LysR family regulator
VSRAAVRLGLSQPAVSNALARLRIALGDPLLVRNPRGMTPTPRALTLEKPLRESLRQLRLTVHQPPKFDPAVAQNTFVLAGTDYVQLVLLPALTARLAREAPGVRLRLLPIFGAPPWHELTEGVIDLVLTGAGNAPKGLFGRLLFRDRIVCVVRRDHPAVANGLTLETYLALSHIETPHLGAQGLTDEILAHRGVKRSIALNLPHYLVAPFVVPRTDYAFTLAERFARPMAELLDLSIFPLPFEMPGVVVRAHWHRRVHREDAHTWLRGMIVDVAASLSQ